MKLKFNLYRGGAANEPDFLHGIDESITAFFSAGIVLFNDDKFRYQEIGISRVSIGEKKIINAKIEQTILAAKYEYGWLGKQFDDNFAIRLGGALELIHGKNHFTPTPIQEYPIEQKFNGAMLSFSPHLDVRLSERLFIDLNPSVVLLTYYFEQTRTQNPTLPLRAQKQGSFGLNAGGILWQMGVGYKF